jgi:hypothetical protein
MYVRIRGTSFGIKLYPNKSLFGNKKKKKTRRRRRRKGLTLPGTTQDYIHVTSKL